ncbi:hypothetical protein V6N12_035397 [Hibiscus sabdariffa]|uniref:Uncharacterized protein n=1 Tax=Hibiscus sabdariffa TaxID=183260 RepID=A0ABR2EML3_9ROSI
MRNKAQGRQMRSKAACNRREGRDRATYGSHSQGTKPSSSYTNKDDATQANNDLHQPGSKIQYGHEPRTQQGPKLLPTSQGKNPSRTTPTVVVIRNPTKGCTKRRKNSKKAKGLVQQAANNNTPATGGQALC